MDWTWYVFFPLWLVVYTKFELWAIVVAVVMITIGFFMERRIKKTKHAQALMLDYVLEEYTVTEGLRYQADPKGWVYPELRHTLDARIEFIDNMNNVREELAKELQDKAT